MYILNKQTNNKIKFFTMVFLVFGTTVIITIIKINAEQNII